MEQVTINSTTVTLGELWGQWMAALGPVANWVMPGIIALVYIGQAVLAARWRGGKG